MARQRQLTVGVLGGMGPAATLDFMSKVMTLTGARTDQEHVRMLVDHNPKVPNRQQAIRQGDPEVPRVLADMARRLEQAGADFLVMPCNSAHVFAPAVREATGIPLVSIIRESVDEVQRRAPGTRRVGVMATDGLQESGLFQRALADAGYEPVLPGPEGLRELMTLIHRIKAGDIGEDVAGGMREQMQSLLAAGAGVVIAGCTEIPLVLSAEDAAVPLVSSTDVLARRTVELALGRAPLPSSTGT